MSVEVVQVPPPFFVEYEGWLCVMFGMQDVPDVAIAARELVELFMGCGIVEPQVVVVDHRQASIVTFDRARCVAGGDVA